MQSASGREGQMTASLSGNADVIAQCYQAHPTPRISPDNSSRIGTGCYRAAKKKVEKNQGLTATRPRMLSGSRLITAFGVREKLRYTAELS
jgi:hypothetical protein